MKSVMLSRLLLGGLALAISPACSETAAETIADARPAAQAEVPTARDPDAIVAEMFAEGRKPTGQRPDFSADTVLKLNPVVARAKAALDRFDDLTPELAKARQARDTARIAAIEAELAQLKSTADAASSAFQAEKKALLARDEYYNEIVLAAMEQFVTEAPLEIADALKPANK
jgi:hypothetical protein